LIIDLKNKEAKNMFSVTFSKRKSRIRHCWRKWFLDK